MLLVFFIFRKNIDQGPIVVMIENYRSGLIWKLFRQNKDNQTGLKKLGFESPAIEHKNEK